MSRYAKGRRVFVRYAAGPLWRAGPPEDQAGWDAHNDFVDDLIARGVFVMGGPFSDYSGSMVLFDGLSVEQTRRVIENDPFVQNGVFLIDDVRDWTIYVDELSR